MSKTRDHFAVDVNELDAEFDQLRRDGVLDFQMMSENEKFDVGVFQQHFYVFDDAGNLRRREMTSRRGRGRHAFVNFSCTFISPVFWYISRTSFLALYRGSSSAFSTISFRLSKSV